MADKIFFRQCATDKPAPFERAPYNAETVLQALLEEAPEVIAGFTTTDSEPTRLVLIKREMGARVADTNAVMRIDHVFADADGVPVLVEVKRASNYESRREVIAQVLDYAANAAAEWTPDVIRSALEARAGVAGVDDYLAKHHINDDADEFIGKIVGNLAAGKMRLMIVADSIPASLRRIIEFLNQQMAVAEILGVEVPQYVGAPGTAVYVPRLVGQTTAAKKTKQAASGRQWDEATVLEEASVGDPVDAELVNTLLEEISQHGRPSWGRGSQAGVGCWYRVGEVDFSAWMLWTGSERSSRIQFRPESLKKGWGEEGARRVLVELSVIQTAKAQIDRAAGRDMWVTIPLRDIRGVSERNALSNAMAILRDGGTSAVPPAA